MSRMNEQVFTAIRQQRDAARLALIAAMSPHKAAERPSNELDMLPTHSIFDTSKDVEEYFSKLDVCDDHDANRSTVRTRGSSLQLQRHRCPLNLTGGRVPVT